MYRSKLSGVVTLQVAMVAVGDGVNVDVGVMDEVIVVVGVIEGVNVIEGVTLLVSDGVSV
jgi:hypothetical protein